MARLKTPILMLTVIVTVAAGLTACSSSGSGGSGGSGGKKCSDVKIGYFGPITGASASFGTTALNATKLAVKDFEAAHPDCKIGGILQFDSQGDPGQAPALALKAVKDNSLVGLVGPGFSGPAKAVLPIFNEAHFPVVTSSSTNAALAKNGWTVFHRTVGNDGIESPANAKYVVDTLHAKKVAVVDNGEEYGQGSADGFAAAIKKLGGQVVMRGSIDANSQDYSSTVISINSKKPDLVYCGCLYPEGGRLVKQLRASGSTVKYDGPSGIYSPGFVKAAGAQAAEGAYSAAASTPITGITNPKLEKFAQDWKSAYKTPLDIYAPEGYDAASALLNAIGAGNYSRESINNWLNSKCDFTGLSGQIKFGPDGDVIGKKVAIYQVKKGNFTVVAQL